MPIKILFHLNQAGYGGTEKAILTFCENLDRNRFKPYLFIYKSSSRSKYYRHLLQSRFSAKAKKRFYNRYISSRARLPDFIKLLGNDCVFEGQAKNFAKAVNTISPDIVHFNRGKWEPFFDQLIALVPQSTVCVETNIFGYPAADSYFNRMAKVYFVSHWLLKKSPWSGAKGNVLYNPIKKPASERAIRNRLGIPDDAFVAGRISRPDLADDNFILDVFNRIPGNNVFLLVLAGSEIMRNAARQNSRIRLIDATTDETVISGFYNSIDLLLHYRIEGETFGMNIAEAMIHGKPVISHMSNVDNAQAELLADSTEHGTVGYFVAQNDMNGYLQHIMELMNDRAKLATFGRNARQRAQQLFQEDVVTRYLENEYLKLLSHDYGAQ
ncbi:MAG: glycosyltransferase family 4 protein [Gammaproteobacteria bacterium]|nr:glycosyltransferase family 4 protein [Gammaproteobacteria bacterium]